MAFRFVAGPNLNHLTRMANAATMTPAAHTLFPATNAYDNRAARPAIFSAGTSDATFQVDLNLIAGSEFESTDASGYWTMLGSGSIATSTSTSYSGSGAGYVQVATSEAYAYQDIDARAGEQLVIMGATASTASSYIRIRNRITGNWLSTDGTWGAAQDFVVSATSGGWASDSVTFTVEDVASSLADAVKLRVFLHAAGANAYFDEVALFPSVDWASVHGHNISPFITPTLQYSTTASTWDTAAAMTIVRDSFYTTLVSLESYRYWRLLLDGSISTDSFVYLGEWVLGQQFSLLQNPSYGGSLRWQDHQTRVETDLGESFVHLHNVAPQRRLLMQFTFPTDAEYEQFHKTIFRGSRGGGNLTCVAPVEMDSDVVILGRLSESIDVQKNTGLERTSLLELLESPLPNAPEVAHAYDALLSASSSA